MIIFDEKKYAEQMIKKGFQTTHKNVYELFILAKYYYHIGHSSDEVKEYIIKYCKKHIDHFSYEEWYKLINRIVKSAPERMFITDKEVTITQKELNKITSIENKNEQKIAFVMLVLYKFHEFNRFKVTIEELYRLAKLNLSSQSKLKHLHSLTKMKLIDIDTYGKRWVKFADKRGKSVITIRYFEDFIYEFLNYISDGKFGICNECGKTILITGKNTKYCKECKCAIRVQQNREKSLKYYHKKRLYQF